MKTSIEWCDHSINPIRARHKATGAVGHYCEKVASGCTNCYSSRMQPRFGMPQFGSGQHRKQFDIFLDETKLEEVRRRKKPTRYFWCDMTDIFGDWMEPEWLAACFAAMDDTPQHTHILLTKRPTNIRKMWPEVPESARCSDDDRIDLYHWKYQPELYRGNVYLGTSVSEQRNVDQIYELVGCRNLAPVLFVSAEPLIGVVDLSNVHTNSPFHSSFNPLSGYLAGEDPSEGDDEFGERGEFGIDWVIVGGESGPGARPCDFHWILSIVDQCRAASVPVFVKQLGAWSFNSRDPRYAGGEFNHGTMYAAKLWLNDSKGGDWSEWPADLRVRQFPIPQAAGA